LGWIGTTVIIDPASGIERAPREGLSHRPFEVSMVGNHIVVIAKESFESRCYLSQIREHGAELTAMHASRMDAIESLVSPADVSYV
jgi:hypothetical protein